MPAAVQAGDQFAPRLLARADHDRVDREHLRHAVDDDVQARVVDLLVFDAGDHRDAAALEQRAPNPAGRLREARADLRFLALQQPQPRAAAVLVRRPSVRRAMRVIGVDAPLVAERGDRRIGNAPSLTWPSGASPADRNSATSKPMPPAPTIATVRAGRLARPRRSRRSSRPSDGRCRECAGMRGTMPVASSTSSKPARSSTSTRRPSRDVDAEPRQPRAEVAQRLGKFFLAGNAPREIELAADLVRRRRTASRGARARPPSWPPRARQAPRRRRRPPSSAPSGRRRRAPSRGTRTD